MSLALVYLSRGIDGGLTAAESFFRAYQTYPPGCPHELIVILKGWEGNADRTALQKLAENHNARIVQLPDDGYDWGAYLRVALILRHTWVCFLNTHSRPRVARWLSMLMEKIADPREKVGAVAATGSWQSAIPKLFMRPINDGSYAWFANWIKLPGKALMLWHYRGFPPFPNPHIRSNVFLTRLADFKDYAVTQKIPRNKRDAYKMESGKQCFSAFLAKRRLVVRVVAANGEGYDASDWMLSGTYRSPDQPGLLVTDNQTKAYQDASLARKRILEQLAWGQTISSK